MQNNRFREKAHMIPAFLIENADFPNFMGLFGKKGNEAICEFPFDGCSIEHIISARKKLEKKIKVFSPIVDALLPSY